MSVRYRLLVLPVLAGLLLMNVAGCGGGGGGRSSSPGSSQPSTPSWKLIGPEPMTGALPNFGGPISGAKYHATGRITALAVDSSGRVFLGGAGGGIWTSTDGGQHWTSIGDSLPTQAVGAIAINPRTTPTTVYVGTGEGNYSIDSYYGQGIFRSTDLGAHWTRITPPSFDHVGVAKLAIDTSQTPVRLFAATGPGNSAGRADPSIQETNPSATGLWKSSDGGATWTQYPAADFGLSPGSSYSAFDVAIDPANPSRIYAAMAGDNVFRSTNGGATWSPVCFSNDTPCSFASSSQLRQSIAVGPPAQGAPKDCSGGTKRCGVVYAMVGAADGAEYLGLFKSVDGGTTWTAEQVPSWHNLDGITIDGTSPGNFSQSFYDQTLLVDPSRPSTVFFGGVGLYESTDSGARWSFLPSNGGVHSDQHALAIAPNNDRVYVGNDGGVYRFSISAISGGTATFTALNNTLPVGQIQGIGPKPGNNLSLIAGFQDNGTDVYDGTSNNPLAWAQTDTGDGGFALFDQVNPKFAYHTYSSVSGPSGSPCAGITTPELATSSDGGNSWNFSTPTSGICTAMGNARDTGASFYPPIATDPNVAGRVLVGAQHIYVSDNHMRSWSEETTQDLGGACGNGRCALQDIEFAPSDHTRAWALSMTDSTFGFKLWNTTQAECPDRSSCPGGVSSATWNNVTANLPFSSDATQATGISPDPNNAADAYLSISGFTASTGVGHIFRTKNFGATWVEADGATTNAGNGSCSSFSALPDVPVLRVLVDRQDPSGNTIYAATDIGVFKSTDGGCTWVPLNLGVLPAVPVFDIEQNRNGTIFIGTHGRGAYRLRQ